MPRVYSGFQQPVRIAISTSGGDAPGLNAVIRAATMAACEKGHQMFGLREGFRVLLEEGTIEMLDQRNTMGIERLGGTMLGARSEEHTSELQSRENLVCRLLLEKKKRTK